MRTSVVNFWTVSGLVMGACFAGCTVTNTTTATDGGAGGPNNTLPDSGALDSGSPTPDSGTPTVDGATPAPDAGADAQTNTPDADAAAADSGTSITVDGGTTDAGEAGTEAGVDLGPLPVIHIERSACTITTATHWTRGLYVLPDCTIDVKAPLIIDPGSVIKFGLEGSMWTTGSGTITAQGTAAAPIVFTSIKDDAAGGDTNADGTASTPAPADWQGVALQANGSKFDHCVFRYAGASGQAYSAGLSVRSGARASLSVTNSVFAHNRGTRATIDAIPALDATEATAGTIITGNTFYDNTVPLGINPELSLDDSNVFDNAAAAPTSPQPNQYNGIVVDGCKSAEAAISWAATKVPYIIGHGNCVSLTIDQTAHLTLGNDVVLKFFKDGNVTVNGVLTANAVTGKKIVFTSIKDDTSGDTNGDGAATTPAGSDWNGITVRANGSSFANCQFLYAGGADSGHESALTLYEASASVTNSIFAHNKPASEAITAPPAFDASEGTAGTVITGNVFYNNTVPLAINMAFSLDDSNSFDNAAAAPLVPAPNTFNGINVRGCGAVTGNISWSPTKVPLVVGTPLSACSYMSVEGGGHLTLGPNVIMKFFRDGTLTVDQDGQLTPGTGAFFTSIKDDRGGDTNHDATATSPAAGDWYGIRIYTNTDGYVCQAWASMNYYTAPDTDGTCP